MVASPTSILVALAEELQQIHDVDIGMLAKDAQSVPPRFLQHLLGTRDLRHELLIDVLLAVGVAYLIPIESLMTIYAVGLREDLSVVFVRGAVCILARAVQVAHPPNQVVSCLLER